MLRIPETASSLLIRTDYSNQSVWNELRERIEATNDEGFRAYIAYYDDPLLAGRAVGELVDLVRRGPFRTFFFVVDADTVVDPEHPVLVIDVNDQPERTFRVVPSEMWSVENNLNLSNMDFREFADNLDADGIFRGFD